jgi:4-hydroxy-3-polyprenylbenzoate decarboxylase
MKKELALVISGGSGTILAQRFAMRAIESGQLSALHVILTDPARLVLAHELGPAWGKPQGFKQQLPVENELRELLHIWSDANLMAPVSSGSHRLDGTVILPCSAGMAGSLANGISRGLGQRVGDVALKQRWPFVIGIRETPMSAILLENLLTLARAGANILPPVPAFYIDHANKDSYELFLDHYCLRVLDLLGIETTGPGLRWTS